MHIKLALGRRKERHFMKITSHICKGGKKRKKMNSHITVLTCVVLPSLGDM